MIKTTLKAAAIAGLISSPAMAAEVPAGIHSALKLWDPTIEVVDNKLVITTSLPRVTDTIYSAMAGGLCMSTYDTPHPWGNVDYTEAQFLNQFGVQGYVMEKPRSTCAEYGELPASESKLYMMSHTRLY